MVTWAISIARIEPRRRLICQPSNTHPTTSPRRRPPDANARRRIARSRVSPRQSIAQVTISRSKPSQATARLLLRCRGRGEAQTANRSAERRLGAANGPSIPFQRCSVLQPASRRLTVLGHRAWGMGAIPTQRPLRPQAFGDFRQAFHVGDRSPASTDPKDDAPRISTRAPPSPATTAAGRWRPPRSPNGRDPTRSPQAVLANTFARDALRSRHRQ
jgi:hypothetical protein